MKKIILSLLFLTFALATFGQQVFINEIHYDNDGADIGEGIEIAGPAGTDLSGYSLTAYNGNAGTSYSTVSLSGTLTNQSNGYGTAFFAISGLQNGAPDGLVLYDGSNVIQFLSYEGVFIAVGGVADGMASTDIGVNQTSSTVVNTSLQLMGEGTLYEDFTWVADSTSSYNDINVGQVIGTPVTTLFINEIHYDNDGSDVNEGVELAGTAGLDLAGWSLVAYNGSNGTVYNTVSISGILNNESNGFGTAFFAISGLQNGAPDGIALVDPLDSIFQFLSYEGIITATNGPASGLISEDIGASETSATPIDFSLQLTGTGSAYTDFTWSTEMLNTYDSINTAQSFGGEDPVDTTVVVAGTVFINEIHYDNSGSDTDEGVELAGTSGIDLTGYTIEIYNGNGGASYGSTNLSGVFTDQQAGFGTLFFPVSGMQNGAPDGIALVDPEGNVLEFLSYEGSFTATSGAANGMASTDVLVMETSSTPTGFSLQLIGMGSVASDFIWTSPIQNTYNAVNTGQTFISPEPVAFINEIHYDNASSDIGEGVEIAGTAGTDLTGWSLLLYNGNNGATYNTTSLSGVISNQDNGFGTLSFDISGIQNGAPDGIALINDQGEVIEFLSYEGVLVATDGPASGLSSTDIGVSETSSTPAGNSLQLVGVGNSSIDFTWSEAITATFGSINTGQSFAGVIEPPTPTSDTVTVAQARLLNVGTKVVVLATLTASDQFGGPGYLQDSTAGIAIFDSQVHADDLFEIGDQLWISAEIGAFSNQIQLVNVDSVTLVGNQVIEPSLITLSELINFEGQLITIENASFDTQNGLLYPNSNYTVSDASGSGQLRVDAEVNLVGRLVPIGATTITGVVGRFQTTLQILPRFIPDLSDSEEYIPTGSDIPFENTVDIATWNMEFFGSEIANFGPSDIELQRQNAVLILQNLNADIIAVQEVANEPLLNAVIAEVPQYKFVCSQVYSRSFQPSDGTFPAQKLCFIYDTTTVNFISDRVIFDQFYTDARTGVITDLDDHPGSNGAQSFWSSGRLPYMMTAEVTAQGVSKEISLVNIHAKSGGSASDLARKVYDIGVLKDSLDAMYGDRNLILLGDYNDDVDESIGGGPSTYEVFINDTAGYAIPTMSLSEAGFRSFVFSENMIDHITISDGLFEDVISGSENTFIPFSIINNYAGTTSDHLPVSVRFDIVELVEISVSGSSTELFHGYSPFETSTLSTTIEGGTAPFSYLWSTGEETTEISVSPDESTTYFVSITDASGQTATDSIAVNVTDVSCGWYGNKVSLCWGGYNLCVPEYIAWYLLNAGASLGECSEEDLPYINRVYINPNPFYRDFKIFLDANKDFEMNVVLSSFYGKEVLNETVDVSKGHSSHLFSVLNAPRGLYIIQLVNNTTGKIEKRARLYKRR